MAGEDIGLVPSLGPNTSLQVTVLLYIPLHLIKTKSGLLSRDAHNAVGLIGTLRLFVALVGLLTREIST
jgi:hypothetical protein